MKKFKKVSVVILSIICLWSCKMSKDLMKVNSSSNLKEQIITKTVKKGDTVTFVVPKVTYKDTTITTYNKRGSGASVNYDINGLIDKIQCIEQSAEEWRVEQREHEEKEKIKSKETETKTTFTFELIALVIVFLAGFFLYKNMNSKISTITNLIQDLKS